MGSRLKAAGVRGTKKAKEPLWKGPVDDGITQSLLSQFIICPDRFKVKTIDGLGFNEGFSHRLEYGSMWHVCEEALASTGDVKKLDWQYTLNQYCQKLVKKYPMAVQQIEHWYNVCKVQFPLYVDWWRKNDDVKQRTPLMQEVSFRVPYLLPSGRTVTLRGKWDSVDLIGKGKTAAIYLQENKSKGDIDPVLMKRMLESGFELQTMFYLVALLSEFERTSAFPGLMPGDIPKGTSIAGVRYNVVRRPLAGGKGSIKRHEATQGAKCPKCKGAGVCPEKNGSSNLVRCSKCEGARRIGAKPEEPAAEFYARLGGIIKEAIEPNGDHYFFMRWKSEVSPKAIQRFKDECLHPILERLCNWWEFQATGKQEFPELGIHYRLPYNIYNPLAEGRVDDIDAYLLDGNEVGLQRLETLFPELDD